MEVCIFLLAVVICGLYLYTLGISDRNYNLIDTVEELKKVNSRQNNLLYDIREHLRLDEYLGGETRIEVLEKKVNNLPEFKAKKVEKKMEEVKKLIAEMEK